MKLQNRKRFRRLGTVCFVLYLAAMVYFLFFAESMGRLNDVPYRYNLIPFREIMRFYNNMDTIGYKAFMLNVAGNVAAFIPFGFFLPLVARHRSVVGVTTLLTLCFSILIEVVQLVTKVGALDVDDVILNTLGGFAGAVLYVIIRSIYRALFRRRRR